MFCGEPRKAVDGLAPSAAPHPIPLPVALGPLGLALPWGWPRAAGRGSPPLPPASPAAPARCDGSAGAYSATITGAVARPNALPFGTRASAISRPPLRAFPPCPGKTPRLRVLGWQGGRLEPRFTVGAIAGSPAVADAAGPWISGHPALLPGAGRLHVDVGWAHPRPVAANDADIVSGSSAGPGIATAAPALGNPATRLTPGKAGGADPRGHETGSWAQYIAAHDALQGENSPRRSCRPDRQAPPTSSESRRYANRSG
jgi:hypothetical protein